MVDDDADDAVLTAPPRERREGKQAVRDYWRESPAMFTNATVEVGRSARDR
jgi:ketosteroid isomerase-like protein